MGNRRSSVGMCDGRFSEHQALYPVSLPGGGIWSIRSGAVLAGATTNYPIFRFPASLNWVLERIYLRLGSNVVGTANADLILKVKVAGFTLLQTTLAAAKWSANSYLLATSSNPSAWGGMVSVDTIRPGTGAGRHDGFVVEDDLNSFGGIANFGTFNDQTLSVDVELGSHASASAILTVVLMGRTID
jgi:hypothetical protein